MRDNKLNLLFLIFFMLMVFVVAACSTDSSAPMEGQSVLERQCVECHNLSRVRSAGQTREEWSRTIDRMIALGAELTSEEREVLLDYLEATYP